MWQNLGEGILREFAHASSNAPRPRPDDIMGLGIVDTEWWLGVHRESCKRWRERHPEAKAAERAALKRDPVRYQRRLILDRARAAERRAKTRAMKAAA